MQILQITWAEQQCVVRLPDGRSNWVTLSGSRRLPPNVGWRPTHALWWPDGVVLLEWEQDGGERATWYLDADLVFLDNAFTRLPVVLQRVIQNTVVSLFGEAWDQIMCNPHPKVPARCSLLCHMSQQSLNEVLFSGSLSLADLSLNAVDLHDTSPDKAFVINQAGSRLRLEGRFLLALLDSGSNSGSPFSAEMASARATGRLVWPSPVDGKPLSTAHALPLHDGLIAYRVTDDRFSLTFFVILGWAHKAFVYFPSARQIYAIGDKAALLRSHSFPPLERLFAAHICSHLRLLSRYLDAPITGFSLVLRLGHLGHHLWNELTETQLLLDSEVYDRASDIILMHGSRLEPLGRLDEIFAPQGGRIIRNVYTHRDLIRHCYETARCVIEPTTFFIPRALANRIIDVNLAQAEVQPDAADLARHTADGYQTILIGLRVENRTDIDLAGFCICVIDAALQAMGRIVVAIDCINAEFGGIEPRLLEAQSAVVRAVTSYFRDSTMRIVDLGGAPVSRSLFWSVRARFFVALWGAGLAKYRWLANRPGLVVSSQWNLRHRGDLHIYDDPQYMEDPAPIVFMDPSCVEDLPDAPTLMTYGLQDRRSTANFSIDRTALKTAVQRLCLAATETQTAPARGMA